MEPVDLRELLEQVQAGKLEIEAALDKMGRPLTPSPSLSGGEGGVADLGFAQLDLHRAQRCGFPEVIFCQGKTCAWIEAVVRKLHDAKQHCLATRVNDSQADHLARQFPDAQQDRIAQTFWLPAGPVEPLGRVMIITAGTSDLPVAREALVTAQAVGSNAQLLADVGVAGIHRLLRHQQDFAGADAIVVVAGMDGALPSVVGGLVDCPVIAVPTSIGYGAAFGGLAPLLTMLNACSANVVVVNIDSGFKAGYVAALIARRAAAKK